MDRLAWLKSCPTNYGLYIRLLVDIFIIQIVVLVSGLPFPPSQTASEPEDACSRTHERANARVGEDDSARIFTRSTASVHPCFHACTLRASRAFCAGLWREIFSILNARAWAVYTWYTRSIEGSTARPRLSTCICFTTFCQRSEIYYYAILMTKPTFSRSKCWGMRYGAQNNEIFEVFGRVGL